MAEDIDVLDNEEFPQTEDEITYEVEAIVSEGEPESIPDVVTFSTDTTDSDTETTDQTDTTNETTIIPDESIVDFGIVPEEPDNTENQDFPIKKRTTTYIEKRVISDFSSEALEEYMTDPDWHVYAMFNDNTEKEIQWDEVYDPGTTDILVNVREASLLAYAMNQHYWGNDNGIHVTDDTSEAWATEWAKTGHGTLSSPTSQKPWHNILMNSLGILIRTGIKNLAQLSAGGLYFYDGVANSADHVTAAFGPNGAQIGMTSSKHVVIDSSGLSVYDETGAIAPVFASNIAADHAKIGDLIADTADIDTIRANSAKVNDVTAEAITAATGYIATLTAGEIAASDLIADHASIDTLETNTADIATIRANSAKVKDVTAQAITAATGYIATLTSKNITANDMAAAHANVGVLLANTADIATIRANSAKVKDVTAEAITAATGYIATLTTGEIAASDLIADHASIDTLETNTADIATIRANSAKVKDVTAQAITAATGYIADLNSKNITANDISADHASIDTLEANTADIDTIRANSAKVNNVTAQMVDSSLGFVTSLMAGELTANDLIADHASVDTLKTNTADINEIRANSAKVKDVTAQAIVAATGYITTLTSGNVTANNLVADHGVITTLNTTYASIDYVDSNYAHITNGVIDNAKIDHADVNDLDTTYAHITNGVIDNAKIDHADVNDLSANYASLSEFQAEQGYIDELQANTADIGTIRANSAKVKDVTAQAIVAATGYIATLTSGNVTANNLVADHGTIANLDTTYAHITNGVIDNAKIDHADVNNLDTTYAHITNGVIDNAKIDHADVNDLDTTYAHITNGVIDNAKIDQGNVNNLRANYAHTTNGVIDNAKIDQGNVNNLRANYAHMTNGVIDNAKMNHADVNGLNANYAHITNGVIDNAEIDQADVTDLEAYYAHITDGVIDNADISHANVDGLSTNYAHITNGVIDEATINYAKVNGLNANYAHITNGVIDNAEIDQADVNNLDVNYAHITDGVIDNATIDQAYVTDLETHYASIANGVINNATIDQADVNNLDTHYAHITNGVIDNADINYADVVGLNANYAHITNGVIDNAEIDYADVNDLDAHYAQIDMANVSNGWLTNGVIKNGAIKNGMIESVTASKLTAGTINADTVNITNLKAENIKVSKINGVAVTGKSVKDALEQHEDDISDLDSKIDDAIEDLNDRIDAQIETWTTDTIPLLSNYPASSWNTNDLKAEHVGDICYVINAVSDADGYTYRFAYDNTTSSYKWVLIKDNQVTAALGRINDLETFESNTSTWIDETDEGLTTIRENHTALSGRVDKTLISTTQLWFTKANTTAPGAPSAHVTVNNPATANAWNIAVPTYNASYPNYYYCYEWQYADNTYGWSAVTRDIATGEMQATARSAQNTANSAIKSSIQLWYIKANDTAPSKPTKTSDVVSNAATANKWNTLVPTYNNSYPYYFYCWQYQKANNTYIWSDVVYDRATTENQANSRNAQATLATKVDSSTFSELVETVDEHSNTITSLSTVSETLIKESIEYIVGTQTAVTGSWTGVTREAALYNGKTIAYRLPYAGSGNASLNLTLAGGGTTGAKAVYINNTRVTTHYPANSIITLTYNGTDWRASAYWDGNTYDRTRYSVYIKIVTAATRTWQMFVGNNDGYRKLVAGISYDLSYPLLVFSDTPAAGETKNTGYLCVSGYIYNIYVGTTVQSAAVNKLVYLKGTVNGTIFTVASSNFLTCAVPTTEDNFFYIPLGVITVVDSTNTTGYFQTNDQLWAYVDGKFQQANPMAKTTNTVVNEVKQTADTNTASIRGLTTITDNLSLFNNGHPGYWRIDRYKETSRFTSATIIPEYSDFSDVNFIETIYKTDEEFNVNWNIDNNYLAKIYTYVHTTEDVTITGYRFAHDNGCVLYVNNEEIGKSGSTTPFTVEFTLTSGWNKIEALLYESTGYDYVRFIEAETTTAVSILSFTGVDRIQADLPVFDSETTEHKISEIVQTIDGFQTTVSNTYATKNSFNALQDSFNNLEIGGRNLLKNTSLPMTKTVTIGDSGWQAVHFYEMVKPYINFFKLNDELTISFNWETNNTTGGNWRLECGQTNPYTWGTVVKAIGTRSATSNYVDISSNNYSGYVAITCKATQTHINNGALLKYLKIRWDGIDWNGKTFTISNAKVEKGNKVTDWTPAPEDIDETTNNIATNLDTEIKQRKALYATCYTGATAQDKTGTCSDFAIYSGVKIAVKFTNGNSHVLPTLNINGTGAFNIKSYSGNNLSIDNKEYEWIGNSIHEFIYDGTNWRLIDSGITSRITQAETKIDQNTEAITLRATKTEAIQIAQPNLSPVGSYDIYPTAAIPDTRAATVGQYWKYWTAPCVGNVTRLSDGWMHYDCTNTNSSGVVRVEWAIEKSDDIKPGTLYTFLVEVRNVTYETTNATSSVAFYLVQSNNSQFWGGSTNKILEHTDGQTNTDTTINLALQNGKASVIRRYTKYSEASGSTHIDNGDFNNAYKLMMCNCNVGAGQHIIFDARISVYEGEYWGVYKPYVGKQLYSTQAELKVANDAISTKVETNGVISAINQSAEQITIDANRVNISGAAIFTTGALKKVVTSSQNEWYSSTSASSLTGGSWATTQPSVAAGRFIWTREKLTYSDGTSEYKPSQNGVCTQGQTNLSNYYTKTQVDDVTNTLAPKSSAATKTQRIWYRTTTTKTLTGPTTWVTATGDIYNDWTTKCPPLASNLNSGGTKYPYLYTCVQTQTVAQAANNGTSCTCSAVLLDDSTTVIDGGKLITGSVVANKIDAADINASGMLTVGALSQATQNDILNENVIIGGRNLTLNGNAYYQYDIRSTNGYFSCSNPLNEPNLRRLNTTEYGKSLLNDTNNEFFTVSFDYTITDLDTECYMYVGLQYSASTYSATYPYISKDKTDILPVGDSSGHHSFTFTPRSEHRAFGGAWLFNLTGSTSNNRNAKLTIHNFKFELGTKETGFNLAPENIDAMNNPNILPFFSIDPNDSNYWYTFGVKNTSVTSTEGYKACYIEPDGWAHIIEDTRAASGNANKTGYQNLQLKPNAIVPFIKPNTVYTLLIEVKDLSETNIGYIFTTNGSNDVLLNAFTNDYEHKIYQNGAYYSTLISKSAEELAQLTRANRGYIFLEAERYSECRMRISLYEGYYSGPYKPYVGKLLYPTNTDLATTNLTLSGAVVDTQTIYIQAVSGTNTMAKKTDAWVTIATESTVSDTTGLTPAWTTKRPTYRSKYPVIFIAQQTKLIDGTIVCSTPVKDDTLTIIDGGHITTGTIDASKVTVTNLDASKITTGKVQASQINSTNLHVSAANVDGKLTASQINASGLSIGYSQLTNVPSIPSKVTDLSDGSSYAKTSEVAAAIDDISVGGRNLLFNTSDKWMGPYLSNVNVNNYTMYPYYTDDTSWVVSGRYLTLTFEIEVNMVAGTGGTPHMYPQMQFVRSNDTSSWATRTNTSFSTILTDFTRQVGSNEFVVGNNIYRYSYTGVINETAANIEGAKGIRFGVRADYVGTNTYIKFRNVKLELGNKATAWSPAPEDLAKPPAKNIHPFYSRDIFDLYDPIYNPKGMLTGLLSNAYYEKLENGWIHCHIDNSAGTAEVANASIRPRPLIDHPSDEWLYGVKGYTVMVEIRNNHSTQPSSGNFDMYTQQTSNTQFWGNGTIYSSSREGLVNTSMTINFKTIGENHIFYGHVKPNVTTTQFTDSNNPTYTELFRYNVRVGVGAILDCDMRFSIYEGYYDGEYIPYVEDQTYLNDQKARLDKTDPSNLLLLDDSPLIDISANNTAIKSRWWVMQVGNITNGTLEKTTNGVKFTRSTATGTYIMAPLKPNISFVSGEDLTLSFDYRSNTTQCGQIILVRGNNVSNPLQVTTPNVKPLEVSTNAWKHYEFTFPFQPVSSSVAGQWIPLVQFGFGLAASDSGKWLEIKDGTLKLEKGNTLTRINEAEKRTNVDISIVSINYGSNTATLKATLYVDGVAKTSNVAYQWYKDGQIITGQTLQQLSVTSSMGINHIYSCNVGY